MVSKQVKNHPNIERYGCGAWSLNRDRWNSSFSAKLFNKVFASINSKVLSGR